MHARDFGPALEHPTRKQQDLNSTIDVHLRDVLLQRASHNLLNPHSDKCPLNSKSQRQKIKQKLKLKNEFRPELAYPSKSTSKFKFKQSKLYKNGVKIVKFSIKFPQQPLNSVYDMVRMYGQLQARFRNAQNYFWPSRGGQTNLIELLRFLGGQRQPSIYPRPRKTKSWLFRPTNEQISCSHGL